MAYLPIENYGVIGDMHTVALVGNNGSVDWFCYPAFDSPSVFAAILDDQKGGRFQISPTCKVKTYKQFYWPETNVLVTRFLAADAVGEVVDFMPIGRRADNTPFHRLVRQVRTVRGSMPFRMVCEPAFNYARDTHEIQITPMGAHFHSEKQGLWLSSTISLSPTENGKGVTSDFTLEEGQSATLVLRGAIKPGEPHESVSREDADRQFDMTVHYWRNWLAKCQYTGRWREMVHRSALALKLLTYEPTGAIVAAPTCSLPEGIGGQRNWDYRYTWIRDAAFTVYGFMRLGFTDEAFHFMEWIDARAHETGPGRPLQIMYGIDGRHTLTEETLDHLDGYMGSKPVRIGNGAYNQLQLDIYGELMDSVYLFNKYGTPISFEQWEHFRELTNWVVNNWKQKDEGIWEVRGGQQHFVYSKLMCWVAVDRALRLADKRSFPADRTLWLKTRDEIFMEIMTQGWNKEKQAFVQHYGSDTLDAANLIMPLVFFVSPTDKRMLKTLDAINRPPKEGGLVSNSLVYRYDHTNGIDGLTGEEGTFNMCTFWLVEALTRAGSNDRHRLDQARLIFEQILGHANHLGLYGEETGPAGEALGNFPQAFTHLSLISAAYNLDRALGQ
ncbi:glycoside hydrolase family 15 protein [bacterium]|nr:glycoside hydrolase family 15 protein [bacterium]